MFLYPASPVFILPFLLPLSVRDQLTEVTLLCGHTPETCRAGLTEQNFMLQEMNSRANTATIQFANGTAATDVNGKER